MSTDTVPKEKEIREPSMLDALIPLLFMILLLVTSIVLFGIDAATGPLQVALFMSAVVAAVVAHKNGHSWQKLGRRDRQRHLPGDECHPDPADGRFADWRMEHVRHDCHDGLLRH